MKPADRCARRPFSVDSQLQSQAASETHVSLFRPGWKRKPFLIFVFRIWSRRMFIWSQWCAWSSGFRCKVATAPSFLVAKSCVPVAKCDYAPGFFEPCLSSLPWHSLFPLSLSFSTPPSLSSSLPSPSFETVVTGLINNTDSVKNEHYLACLTFCLKTVVLIDLLRVKKSAATRLPAHQKKCLTFVFSRCFEKWAFLQW